MENFKNLCIDYKKLVNNLSKQGVDVNNLEDLVNQKTGEFSPDINNLQLLLHKMKRTRMNYNNQDFNADLNKMLTTYANNDLFAGNIDLEMYLSWLDNEEFTGNKKR